MAARQSPKMQMRCKNYTANSDKAKSRQLLLALLLPALISLVTHDATESYSLLPERLWHAITSCISFVYILSWSPFSLCFPSPWSPSSLCLQVGEFTMQGGRRNPIHFAQRDRQHLCARTTTHSRGLATDCDLSVFCRQHHQAPPHELIDCCEDTGVHHDRGHFHLATS